MCSSDLNRITFDENRLECLDTHPVKGGCPVQHHRVPLGHLFEDVPNLIIFTLKHLLGALDGIGVTELFEPANNKGLEQLESDLLRQSALVKFQLWTNRDHGTCRVIDSLTEQVLTESTLLTLDHVSQRFQWPLVRSGNRSTAATVIEQGIDRFLRFKKVPARVRSRISDYLGFIHDASSAEGLNFMPLLPLSLQVAHQRARAHKAAHACARMRTQYLAD